MRSLVLAAAITVSLALLQIFLPNPYKSEGVTKILTANKRTFITFLEQFEKDSDDAVFIGHKQEMLDALNEL